MREIIVDNFAGGGGASTGIELAIGRSVDIAINHDENAIAMHKTNHPDTLHYCESVFDVDPVSGMYMTGASMILGGVAQMLAPKPKMSEMRQTDNGRQNTYFSSLDNMIAKGNTLPVLYGEMQVGSRVISQEVSTADEGDGGQVVVIGR